MPKKSLKKEIFNSEKTSLIVNKTESVELKLKIAKTYFEELYDIKNEEDALAWVKSIPQGVEKELLLLIALNRFQSNS